MGGNLAKAPLVGIFYGTLLWFVAALLPRSAAYAEAAGPFVMPTVGLLMLLAVAVVFAAACAVAFGGARKGGVPFIAMLALTACGAQWLAPLLRQLLLGETTGVMTTGDTLFELLAGCGATILALVLAMLLYKTPDKAAFPGGKAPPEAKYKLGVLGLVIRLLVLPLIFFLLYYLLWYFLFWRVDAAREFFGRAEKLNFMGEVIAILVDRGKEAAVTLLVGLAYALISLPLLFQMQGKRVLYIAANTLLYLTAALRYLIPSPIMPDAVRMAHLPETGLLLLLYGIIAGLLLHTAFRKQEVPTAPGIAAKGGQPAAKPQAKPAGAR